VDTQHDEIKAKMAEKMSGFFKKTKPSRVKAFEISGVKFTISDVTRREQTKTDLEIIRLGKIATKLKREKKLDEAIYCLIEQKKLMSTIGFCDSMVERHLRLPKFLQKAGRMAEAIAECREVLRDSTSSKAVIYDAMRLIYQRENRMDESYLFSLLECAWIAVQQKTFSNNSNEKWNFSLYCEKKIDSYFKNNPDTELKEIITKILIQFSVDLDAEVRLFTRKYQSKPKELTAVQNSLKASKREQSAKTLKYSLKRDFEMALYDHLIFKGNAMVSSFENTIRELLEIN